MPDFSFLPNFLEVSPCLLTSAQPSPADFGLLAANGVEVIINLAAPNATNYNPDEAKLALEQGLAYIHLPVVWTAPQCRDFEAFAALLAVYEKNVVLVHCAMNMRVSAFVYAYQVIIKGEDETVARARMEEIWTPNEVWRDFLDELLADPATGKN
jgi:protein tyrosine phosphatase (PTP) superfamily phosphohydrolase (DUF442 family)